MPSSIVSDPNCRLKNCCGVKAFPISVMLQVHLPHVFRQRSFKPRYQIVNCWDKLVIVIHGWPVLLPTSRREMR